MPSEAPVDPGLTQSSARNGTDRALCIGFLPEKLPEGPAATPEEIPTWGNALAGTEGRSAAYAQDAIRAASARCPRRAGIDAACVLPISSPIRTSAARNSANADSCQFWFNRKRVVFPYDACRTVPRPVVTGSAPLPSRSSGESPPPAHRTAHAARHPALSQAQSPLPTPPERPLPKPQCPPPAIILTACGSAATTPSQFSRAAFSLPGRLITRWRPRCMHTARESIA